METKTKITQGEEIIDHIRKNGYITRLEASCELHIFELPARIVELKRKGYNITSENAKAVNKNGRISHFKVYKLEEDDAETI
jgi:hypothetical protein